MTNQPENERVKEGIKSIFAHYWIDGDGFASHNYEEELLNLFQSQLESALKERLDITKSHEGKLYLFKNKEVFNEYIRGKVEEALTDFADELSLRLSIPAAYDQDAVINQLLSKTLEGLK